jgi:hypothetical protein
MTCPKCGGVLERRYRLEVVDAIRGVWKLRLTCRACGSAGFRDPVRGRWLFFDDVISSGHNGTGRRGGERRA